jgi:hypothetical protein
MTGCGLSYVCFNAVELCNEARGMIDGIRLSYGHAYAYNDRCFGSKMGYHVNPEDE